MSEEICQKLLTLQRRTELKDVGKVRIKATATMSVLGLAVQTDVTSYFGHCFRQQCVEMAHGVSHAFHQFVFLQLLNPKVIWTWWSSLLVNPSAAFNYPASCSPIMNHEGSGLVLHLQQHSFSEVADRLSSVLWHLLSAQ